MYDIYENIEQYNTNKEHKVLIVFDDMIAGMLSNQKLTSMGSELFIITSQLN